MASTHVHPILRDYSKNKDGNAPVLLSININGKRWKPSIGVYIKPIHWDHHNQKIKSTHSHASELNMIIRKAISKANDIFIHYKLSDKIITIEKFKFEFHRGELKQDFIHFYETNLERRKPNIEKSTYKYQHAILQKLKEFSPSISFHNITPQLCGEIETFLKTKKNNNAYTIWGFFKTIKTYLILAQQQGIIFNYPFTHYKIKKPKSTPEFLQAEDIMLLHKYFLSPQCTERHRRILRYFIFACLTGLRISDIQLITHNNIINDELCFIPFKTRNKKRDVTRILITPEMQTLINTTSGKLFETISDQKTNIALHEISELLKLKKNLTFHVARHSFGFLAIKCGVSVAVLQKLMGHSNIQTTMIYVHLVNDQGREGIEKMKGLLYT